MIEKTLHFIWIGNNIPSYANANISKFAEINPDFRINFVVLNRDIVATHELTKDLVQQINGYDGEYRYAIDYYSSLKRSKQQILANVLRYKLLNEYGGIYLDCDCYPIKPFDDELLNMDAFVVNRHYTNNFIRRDCYFIGKSYQFNKIFFYDDIVDSQYQLLQTDSAPNDIQHIKNKFYYEHGQLNRMQLNKKYYIYHFNFEDWRK